ncbi:MULTISPECIES: hypothetical protein [unclassified Pseudomonas]|uniref:hypothetical protein n=1 Tax=unclassified Pseudomonas TaxID=196821 RepID=UPI001EE69146|nr:hypothetical protein [Pseudomonas sp. M47T1]
MAWLPAAGSAAIAGAIWVAASTMAMVSADNVRGPGLAVLKQLKPEDIEERSLSRGVIVFNELKMRISCIGYNETKQDEGSRKNKLVR